jgi:hypothetical protein
LFQRPLQALAQALDVFTVQLALLLVHLQQRPQAFDAMPFNLHSLSAFKLAYTSTVSGFRRCWLLAVICCFNCCWFLFLFIAWLVTDLQTKRSGKTKPDRRQ